MSDLKSVFESTKQWAEQRLIPLEAALEMTSTNLLAKEAVGKTSGEPLLFLAGHQTAGRGRGSNSWLDTGLGESLLSTWSFSLAAAPQPIAAPRLGLALFRALSQIWKQVNWSVKAPNDILLNGDKVAGLLIEIVSHGTQHQLLIGLGLNVLNHPRKFSLATHLSSVVHDLSEADWFRFLDELNSQLKSALEEITKRELLPQVTTELLSALNANPRKQSAFSAVSPLGDLVSNSGSVRWEDL